MSYPSFNITKHFDISALGKYRLVAGDAWVDFEVSILPASGTSFPEHLGMIRQSGLYAVILNYGSDVEGMDAEFVAVPYLDGKNNGFSIYWTNNTGESYVVDPKFEISRYNGKEFVPLKDKSSAQDEATVVAPNAKEKHIYSITEHYDLNEKGRYRFTANGIWVDFELKTVKELYTGLDSSRGLDVYVWQMAQGSYSFALLPHSEEPPKYLLFGLPGLRATEMRKILSAYDIDDDDVYIIPTQNPVSSYLGPYWIIREGEDLEAKRAMYEAIIRDMLLGDTPREKYPCLEETDYFDMNGDGSMDACSVGIGLDDGKFFFTIRIRYNDSGDKEIYQRFDSVPMLLEFDGGGSKSFRLIGTEENGKVHYYSVSAENEQIKLTELD
jgi:hypothetical protein